ncbi:hypothetical protein TGVAND_270570 [Toxoplasma gondii VAND]|uniref:Uncharacterized protein n=1 Tax=Toxoplasma gondii VAND TaxID=933077 RepID=A0A086Q003_TOXGO|nr:hypothetical protein TGVAND_270570 [Toxoplasma gondii VAND]
MRAGARAASLREACTLSSSFLHPYELQSRETSLSTIVVSVTSPIFSRPTFPPSGLLSTSPSFFSFFPSSSRSRFLSSFSSPRSQAPSSSSSFQPFLLSSSPQSAVASPRSLLASSPLLASPPRRVPRLAVLYAVHRRFSAPACSSDSVGPGESERTSSPAAAATQGELPNTCSVACKDDELQREPTEVLQRLASLPVAELFALASRAGRETRGEVRSGASARRKEDQRSSRSHTGVESLVLPSRGEEEAREETSATRQMPTLLSSPRPPLALGLRDESPCGEWVSPNDMVSALSLWEAGEAWQFKTAKILDSFEGETPEGEGCGAQEEDSRMQAGATPGERGGAVDEGVELGSSFFSASEDLREARYESDAGTRKRTHTGRHDSLLFEAQLDESRPEADRRAGRDATDNGTFKEEEGAFLRSPQGSPVAQPVVGRQRRRTLTHASPPSSPSSVFSPASSSTSSSASTASPASSSSETSGLSPLEQLRLARPQREFAATDQILRLQALVAHPPGPAADDGSSSAQRALLWRRATRRLTDETTAALSPAALLQTVRALAAGRNAGLLPPSPTQLVLLLNACTEKLVYWTLADQLVILNALSALLLPPTPACLPPSAPWASSALSPNVSVPSWECLSRSRLPTGPSLGRDWGGGALGPAAAVALETLLQRLLAVRESLGVSDLTATLHVYARLGLLSPQAALGFMDALYQRLLAAQVRQQRLERHGRIAAGAGDSNRADQANTHGTEQARSPRDSPGLGVSPGHASDRDSGERQPGATVHAAACAPARRASRRQVDPLLASPSFSLSEPLAAAMVALLRLADSVSTLLGDDAKRLCPAEALLRDQLQRRHAHRMQQKKAAGLSAACACTGSQNRRCPVPAGQEANPRQSEAREADTEFSADGEEQPSRGGTSEENGHRGDRGGLGRRDQQDAVSDIKRTTTWDPERIEKALELPLHERGTEQRASQKARDPGASNADVHSACGPAVSPQSLRLMARLLQHLVEALLAEFSREKGRFEAACKHRESSNSTSQKASEAAAVRRQNENLKGSRASLHPLFVTRLLRALTLLDFHAFSMYSPAQIRLSQRLFEQLFALLRIDDLLSLDDLDGGMGASAAVEIVFALAVQKRLFERAEGFGLYSAKGKAGPGHPGTGREGAGTPRAERGEEENGDRRRASEGLDGKALTVSSGEGQKKQEEAKRKVDRNETATKRENMDKDGLSPRSERGERKRRSDTDGFFFDEIKDEVLPRLVTVAVRHGRTLSVHQHAVLLEALSLHLGFRHDFLLDSLRCSALAAATGALGISSSSSSSSSSLSVHGGRHRVPGASLFAAAWSTFRVFCALLRQHPLIAFPVLFEGHRVFSAATEVLASFWASLSCSTSSPGDSRNRPTSPGFVSTSDETEAAQMHLLFLLTSSLLPHLRKQPAASSPPSHGSVKALSASCLSPSSVEPDLHARGSGGREERQSASANYQNETEVFGEREERNMHLKASTSEHQKTRKKTRDADSSSPRRKDSLRLRPLWVYVHPNMSDFDKAPLCFLEGPIRDKKACLPLLLNQVANETEGLLRAATATVTQEKR